MGYPFALVLHTHLPMVVNHGRWPHGSDWLNEATFECYLPLLEVAHRLVGDGISPKWTLNLSPVLTEQLASPEFQKELAFYYENVRRACAEGRQQFKKAGASEYLGLCDFWEEHYERMWELHRRIGGDIPGTFAELQRGGHVEIITCAATHGYLPLLSRDESIHIQLRTAVETHKRHFGVAPRGIWLPECAYRPRYEWTPPASPSSSIATTFRCAGRRSSPRPRSRSTRRARRTRPTASPRAAVTARRSPSSAIPRRRCRCGAANAAIPASMPTSSSTRSTSRAVCASGGSPTTRVTSAPRSPTTPSSPARRRGCRPATSSASCARRPRLRRRPTGGPP